MAIPHFYTGENIPNLDGKYNFMNDARNNHYSKLLWDLKSF